MQKEDKKNPRKNKSDARESVKDIFNESALRIIGKSDILKSEAEAYPVATEPIKKDDVITDANINLSLNNSTEEKKQQWEKLKDLMDGDFTEKFIEQMNLLPSREFIRVYLKMLEFFKPKITREVGIREEVGEKDIHIHVHDDYVSQKKIS